MPEPDEQITRQADSGRKSLAEASGDSQGDGASDNASDQPTGASNEAAWNRRRNLRIFSAWLIIIAAIIFTAGWTTNAREIAHSALIVVASVALLPLIVIAAGIALIFVVTSLVIVITLVSGGDSVEVPLDSDPVDGVMGVGVDMFIPYYRWLFTRKNPAFWGIGGGLLLGGLLLAAVFGFAVIPGETATVKTLVNAKQSVDDYYEKHGRFPETDEQGRITWQALGVSPREGEEVADGPDNTDGEFVTDGFGRPLRLTINKKLNVTLGYSLRSHGFDGAPGDDDLAVQGSTKLGKVIEAAKSIKDIASKLKNGETVDLSALLGGISDMRRTAKEMIE